jgi:alpha-tubulin suppressor-like RCC1 family protein
MAMRVSAGGDHACRFSRTSAGSFVDCWGRNNIGQLGQGGAVGTPAELLVPTEVAAPSGFAWTAELAAGRTHTCAVGADQRVACWGANTSGQLDGAASPTPVTAPVIVPGVSGVRQISVGASHTCALRMDGTVWCWGRNAEGQLGRGTSTVSEAPGPVPGLVGVAEIAAGFRFTCARIDDGTVQCWGDGGFGQIGDGADLGRLAPATVTGIDDATQLALGEYSACVVRATGRVWCWGYNADGELADDTPVNRAVPVQSVDL